MSYTKYTWVTGEVITADKLNHMEDGIAGGGGITVYKIAYDQETYAAYVEVTDTELIEKAKSGLVLFIDDTNEGMCQTHIVGNIDEEGAHTLYPQSASHLFHTWTYANGKYVLSGD